MVRWQPTLVLLLATVCTSGMFSCMEMVRRAEPSAGQPDPWWGQGNPSEPESVSNEEATSAAAQPAVAGGPSTDPPVESRVSTVETSGESLAEAHARRGRSREESTRQINEYAYWCIENSMWDEARLHLERAVSQDSMSASLFNNLGVIYERQGETDHADSAYARATALLPESQAYAANLRRLRERAEAAARVFIDSAAAEASTSADATGSAAGTAQDSSE